MADEDEETAEDVATQEATLEEDEDSELVVVREGDGGDEQDGPQSEIDEPDKMLRLAGQVRGLLNQAWDCDLDEAGRERLAEIHRTVLSDLRELVSEDLQEELDEMRLPDPDGQPPSDAELRVYQAQLGGWLEGLFHGIQASMASRQAAQQQQMMQQLQQQSGGGSAQPTPGGAGQYL